MGNRFLRIAVIYILIGVVLGIVMSGSGDFTLRPVHAHINLLGWATMALFGLWYRSAPEAGQTTLAKVHFWLHNIALPILMVALTLYLQGNKAIEPVLALSSIAIAIGLLCFAVNMWKFTRE